LSFPAAAVMRNSNAPRKTAAKPSAFVGDVIRATFAIGEMHMRKRPHLITLTVLVASAQTPSVAQSKTASIFTQDSLKRLMREWHVAVEYVAYSRAASAPRRFVECEEDNLCAILTFQAHPQWGSRLP
jgi:hypothetical protein